MTLWPLPPKYFNYKCATCLESSSFFFFPLPGLEFAMQTRLASNFQKPACSCLLRAGNKDMGHYT